MTNLSTIKAAYWHALNMAILHGLGRLGKFAAILGGPQAVFEASKSRLLELGMDTELAENLVSRRKNLDPAKEWAKLKVLGIQVLVLDDDDNKNYPFQLSQIPDPPPIIYVRGNPEVLKQPSLAVVGSRKITSYGHQAISTFVPQLAHLGVHIVSGMAIGVDAAALGSCLESGGVPIGVLASSLADYEIAPQSNFQMAMEIIKKGCLVSENPPGRVIDKYHFPLRNRIVSGLSLGVLVIEANKKSGSLITANLAVMQNREVFAVPGPIFSQSSAGTLDIIKRGAICVTNVQDIGKEFGWDIEQTRSRIKLADPLHEKLYSMVKKGHASIDKLASATKLTPSEVMVTLTEMELLGLLKRGSDGMYAKIK